MVCNGPFQFLGHIGFAESKILCYNSVNIDCES